MQKPGNFPHLGKLIFVVNFLSPILYQCLPFLLHITGMISVKFARDIKYCEYRPCRESNHICVIPIFEALSCQIGPVFNK